MTSMMKYWRTVKDEYPDCIVFFRLGDFYEMFFEDAEKASKILDLTLTGRDCGEEERAPMCGIPYHAVDGYLAKLVEAGCKVAICEQLTDPKKGPVERGVVRVVSAGTVIESDLLDSKKNNFIACCCECEGKFAYAYADITTGEFCVSEVESAEKLLSELYNLSVSEIVCNSEILMTFGKFPQKESLPPFTCYLPWAFESAHAEKMLREQLNVSGMEALGLEDRPVCVRAAGALLEYLTETQKRSIKNINKLTLFTAGEYMVLDPIAVKNLDILRNNADGKKYGSLLWLLDKTKTGMGARLLSSMILKPLLDRAKIEERLDAVQELFDASVIRMGIAESLSGMHDVERLTGKIGNGNLQPRDCVALSKSLSLIPGLKMKLSGFTSPLLKEILNDLVDPKEICELLDSAFSDNAGLLREGNFIKAGFNKRLDELREKGKNSKELVSRLEAREREKTGIKSLKVGFNRVFGYYIEVSNAFRDLVPYSYIRKQTISNGERYFTEELKVLESDILGSSEKADAIEQQLFSEIFEMLEKNIPILQKISEAIARLDCFLALATIAKEKKYFRPIIVEEGALSVKEGRHPVVEEISRERFVPNDCSLDGGENRTLIITGPNMAGKSTYLRQNALIVLMAHLGSFVPAKEATVPLCDRIFTRIGASDNIISDKSTFMVEMTEVANILRNATKRSLLILDEVGRGTSTYDGLSIAWSVIEHLNENVRAKTLFATHYHELTQLEGKLPGVKNYKISVREVGGSVVFLRKIVRGGASRSFGVEVAALAGVPEEVISRAKVLLKQLEKNEITRKNLPEEEEEESDEGLIRELRELNPDLLSPMQALTILSEWKEKYQ